MIAVGAEVPEKNTHPSKDHVVEIAKEVEARIASGKCETETEVGAESSRETGETEVVTGEGEVETGMPAAVVMTEETEEVEVEVGEAAVEIKEVSAEAKEVVAGT